MPIKRSTTAKNPVTKADRAQAADAADPVDAPDVMRPPTGPPSAPAGSMAPARPPFRRPQQLNFAGVGRNDICPCGSGKRFKNCHGR